MTENCEKMQKDMAISSKTVRRVLWVVRKCDWKLNCWIIICQARLYIYTVSKLTKVRDELLNSSLLQSVIANVRNFSDAVAYFTTNFIKIQSFLWSSTAAHRSQSCKSHRYLLGTFIGAICIFNCSLCMPSICTSKHNSSTGSLGNICTFYCYQVASAAACLRSSSIKFLLLVRCAGCACCLLVPWRYVLATKSKKQSYEWQ